MKVALSWDNTLGFASKIKFTKEYPTQKNEHRQKPMNYKHKKIEGFCCESSQLLENFFCCYSSDVNSGTSILK